MSRKRLNWIWLVALIPSMAQATPSNRELFRQVVAPATVDMAYARAANMCALRSDRWLSVFDYAYGELVQDQASKFKLSDEDRHTLQPVMDKLFADTISNIHCDDLFNAPVLKHLDELRDTLTSGYR